MSKEHVQVRSIRAELLEAPKSWTIGLMVVIVLLCIFLIIWANVAELDEVTTGQGQVIPSRKVQIVQNLEGGIVSEILVKEGDNVEEDQVIIKMDDTGLSSSFRENIARYYGLLGMSARLTAEAHAKPLKFSGELIKSRPKIVASETALYERRLQELNSTLDILHEQVEQRGQELTELKERKEHFETTYGLAKEESAILEPLVKQGVASRVELLRLKREVSKLKGDLDATASKINQAKSALDEAKQRIAEKKNQFQAEALTQLNDVNNKLSALKEFLTAAKDRVSRTDVRSPVAGIIKQMHINTVGEVIQPGQDMVEIVPIEDTLLVQAEVSPSDIAFISPEQDAIVKVTAYDFLIYGGLEAKVEKISPDTIMDDKGNRYYQIYVRTSQNTLDTPKGPLPIKPGMVVEVDILTGKKTIFEYLMKPINRARHRAMRER